MEILLLWIETFLLALLGTALVYALTQRLRVRWLAVICRGVAFLLPALTGGFLVFIGWRFSQDHIQPDWLFPYSLIWTLLFVLVFFLIRNLATRDTYVVEACASWSLAFLFGSIGIVLILFTATFFKMDLDARAKLAAAQTRGLANAVSVLPTPASPGTDGGPLYQEAFQYLDLPDLIGNIDELDVLPEIKAAEEVIHNNQEALRLVKRAADMPVAIFTSNIAQKRLWPSFEAELPNFSAALRSCRLLALEVYLNASRGNSDAAFAGIDTMGKVAAHLSSNPHLIATMTGATVMNLQKSTLERALALLLEIKGAQPSSFAPPRNHLLDSYKRSLIMEESAFLFAYSREVAISEGQIQDFLFLPAPYRILMSGEELDFHDEFWRQTHAFIAEPFHEKFKEYQKWETEFMSHPGGIITAISLPMMSRYLINLYHAETNQRLGRLASAAAVYHSDTRKYPSQMSELVPDYINTAPIDPFNGTPLKLKVVDNGLILYSSGPDFQDDGGDTVYQLPYEETKTGDIIFRLGTAYDKARLGPLLAQFAGDGNLDMVQRAVAAGADVNSNTPLVAAAAAGHDEIILLLLENGADINGIVERTKEKKKRKKASSSSKIVFPEDMNALMAAATNGHKLTVQLLLNNGADPIVTNTVGQNSISVASGRSFRKITHRINRENRALDELKKRILMTEAKVKELQKKYSGFFTRSSNKEKLTRTEELLKLLRRKQSDSEEKFNLSGIPGKHTISPENKTNRVAIFNMLQEAGADVNSKDQSGITPLTAAAFENDLETVQFLLNNGAESDTASLFGWTPLIAAKASGNESVKNLLLERGASLSAEEEKLVNRLITSRARYQRMGKRRKK